MGYISIADVRAEGFTAAAYPDARVTAAILQATRLIDKVTGQWFEPRALSLRLDVRNSTLEYLLDVPIVQINSATFWDSVIEVSDLWVYNRHLTMGIQDDLQNPKVVFKRDYVTASQRRLYGGERYFTQSDQQLVLNGVFGYTELSGSQTPQETTPGSQVPLYQGGTPEEIKRAALLLMQRFLPTIASGDGADATIAGRVTGITTQDQSISIASPSGGDGSYGATGMLEVDTILAAYMGPMRVGVV